MPVSMRQTIAKYMTLSKQSIPHFYLNRWVKMDAALQLRDAWNAGKSKDERISVNDIVVKATALALQKFPGFNGYYNNDAFQPIPTVNIGVAVALPEGLIAPAILDCGSLGLVEIARRSRDLAERARSGKLKSAEYSGATFTVSNLGMFQVDTFTAIIIPPQVAILAVGALNEVFMPVDGKPVLARRLSLTLSADHRATDGVDGARFLAEIADALQGGQRLFE